MNNNYYGTQAFEQNAQGVVPWHRLCSMLVWLAVFAGGLRANAADSTTGLIAQWTFNSGTQADLIDEVGGLQLFETGYSAKQTTTFNPGGTVTLGEGRMLYAPGLNSAAFPALKTGFTIWVRMRVDSMPVTSVPAAFGLLNSVTPTPNAQENLLAATLNVQNTLKQRFRGNLLNGANLAASNPGTMNNVALGTAYNVALTFSDAGTSITYADRTNAVSAAKTDSTSIDLGAFQCFALGRLVREGYALLTFDEIRIYSRVLSPAEIDALTPIAAALPVDEFFLTPGRGALVRIQTTAPIEQAQLNYTLSNYAGATLAAGVCGCIKGAAQLPLNVPVGYYEVKFAETGQSFGLCSLPDYTAAADPFFCMDSVLTIVEMRTSYRAKFIRWMKRGGVAMARERMLWEEVNPSAGVYYYQTARNVQSLLEAYAAAGLPVLDSFYAAPAYTGRTTDNPYPALLNATQTAWQNLGTYYQPFWQGLEVWNEPDVGYGAETPADQYLPLLKTLDYNYTQNNLNLPLGGGVFANYTSYFVKQSIANGLLNHADFISSHTYFRAPILEASVRNFRNDMGNAGLLTLPLWLTESGLPWREGTVRPLFDADLLSALEITAKAVESKVSGVARYFPFSFSYYAVNNNSFGMLSKDLSPLRSVVAYFQAVRRLSNKPYLGDLTHAQDASIKSARVFDNLDGRQSVVTLYTGTTGASQANTTCLPDLPAIINRIEGADGRPLVRAGNGAIPIPDGLTYVFVDTARLGAALVTNSPTKDLWNVGLQPLPTRAPPSPVILQHVINTASVNVTKRGYQLTRAVAPATPILSRLHNLSSTPQNVSLTLSLESGTPQTATTVVPANGTVDVPWTVDLLTFLSTKETTQVTINGTGNGGLALSPLALTFSLIRDLPEYLALYPLSARLDVTDLTRWETNINNIGTMNMTLNASNNWQLDVVFTKEGDRWAYPRFVLPPTVDLSHATGFIIRARATNPGAIRTGAKEADGSSYITTFAIMPADGQFHTQLVRFDEIAPSSGGTPDENGHLDPLQILRLTLGMATTPATNSLEVSDVYLLNE